MTTTISGDTGVSQVMPGSIQQDDLANGVVGKGPAFIAYAIADQVVGNSVPAKINFPVEVADTAAAFDTALSRFQPQVAGYYQINLRLRVGSSTTVTGAHATIYKNGSPLCRVLELATIFTTSGSALVYMNGTSDYLEFYGAVSGTGTLSFSCAGDANGLYGPMVSGFLARAA